MEAQEKQRMLIDLAGALARQCVDATEGTGLQAGQLSSVVAVDGASWHINVTVHAKVGFVIIDGHPERGAPEDPTGGFFQMLGVTPERDEAEFQLRVPIGWVPKEVSHG